MVKPTKDPASAAEGRKTAMEAALEAITPVTEGESPFRGLFYARPKVGKTRFGASSGKKTLVLCADPDGIDTLRGLGVPNVDYVQIFEWDQIDNYYWLAAQGRLDAEMIVFDTWTMLTTMCLREVMGQVNNRDPLVPKTDDWQKLAQIMNNAILGKWIFLPQDIVWLCQQRDFKSKKAGEEDETVDQIGPATSPSVKDTLVGAVGTIGRLYKKEVVVDGTKKTQRRMRFDDPSNLYICGSRIRGLPPIMANPTLKSILEIRAQTGELPPDDSLYAESFEVEEEDEDEQTDEQGTPEGGVQVLSI